MTGAELELGTRAQELGRAFDRSFSEAPSTSPVRLESLLAIRVGNDPYAVRLTEVAGLFADKHVTRLPSAVAELVGVCAFRGTVVPVYDLGALLGYPAAAAPRWLLLTGSKTPIGLALAQFEGHFRLPQDDVARARDSAGRAHVSEIARSGQKIWPILSIPSVLAVIDEAGARARPAERSMKT